MIKKDKIELSVIVPAYNAELTIEKCLSSLTSQRYDKNYEIIVIDSSSDRTEEIIRKRFKEIRYVKLKKQVFPGQARNIGIDMAEGDIISFIDSDCIAQSEWLYSIRDSFKMGVDAVGGSVGAANQNNPIALCEYMLEFSDYLSNMPPRILRTIPMCNISYRKEIFKRYGLIPDIRTAQEVVFNWRLFKNGVKIYFNPKIKVRHIHRDRLLPFIRHQYLLGRGFVESRLATDLPGRILLRYPYKLFLPAIRFVLIIKRLLRWDRKLLLKGMRVFPLLLLGISAWTGGALLYRKKPV